MQRTTRRSFLAGSAAGAAVWTSRVSTAASRKPGPNDTLLMGLIGCGGQGRADMRTHLQIPGVRFTAVCDVNARRLQDGARDSGNDQVKTCRDYRRLLEDREIDAVIVATNGHWHVLPVIHACQAGKDVYVEKPLGTSIGEGRAAVEAARRYNRVVQIGTQQRSGDHYQRACEVIRSGRLGSISEVKVWDFDNFWPGFGSPPDAPPPEEFGENGWDLWLGPSPKVPYNPNRFLRHYWFFDYGGGWQLDWAVHHYDIVNWCMGVTAPVSAVAVGGFYAFKDSNTQWPDTFSGICEYGPGPVSPNGFVMQYSFRGACVNVTSYASAHGKVFFGSDASLVLDRSGYTIREEPPQEAREEPWRLPSLTREVERVAGDPDMLLKHARAFVDSVRSRSRPAADVENGHHASVPGHLMNIAWRVGRRIRWDGMTEQVLDDPAAGALVTKSYRAPWALTV